jgi:hypothetical protein
LMLSAPSPTKKSYHNSCVVGNCAGTALTQEDMLARRSVTAVLPCSKSRYRFCEPHPQFRGVWVEGGVPLFLEPDQRGYAAAPSGPKSHNVWNRKLRCPATTVIEQQYTGLVASRSHYRAIPHCVTHNI